MFQVMRDVEKELLVTDSIVYADDRNLLNLSETSAQADITYIHSTGQPLCLVLNLLKCVIRRVVAVSSYTRGTAKRASLTRVLPPPRVHGPVIVPAARAEGRPEGGEREGEPESEGAVPVVDAHRSSLRRERAPVTPQRPRGWPTSARRDPPAAPVPHRSHGPDPLRADAPTATHVIRRGPVRLAPSLGPPSLGPPSCARQLPSGCGACYDSGSAA